MNKRQQGFTIVELMIATLVFSTILISITMGVMYFTRSYYKGVYAASTQDAARSISEQISQSVEFSSTVPSGDITANPGYLCAGNTEFVFSKATKYDGVSDATGAYTTPMTSGVCPLPNTIPVNAQKQQLLGKNMRLANLSLSSVGSIYTLEVTVAYGDNDLLCVYGGTGNAACSMSVTASNTDLVSHQIACKPGVGNEYCAVSYLKTTVQKRLP